MNGEMSVAIDQVDEFEQRSACSATPDHEQTRAGAGLAGHRRESAGNAARHCRYAAGGRPGRGGDRGRRQQPADHVLHSGGAIGAVGR